MSLWHTPQSPDQVLQELEARALARWGEARLPALAAALRATAEALSLLARTPLEPLDEPPDFLANPVPDDA
ncbi:MAG: hypothetical protein HYY02_01805 [Chloroflexi bacterium]|nr:hypothetical protein [Chloroflexota bacterium]